MSYFININQADDETSEQVSFSTALQRGLASGNGLYMPTNLAPLPNITGLLEMPFLERSEQILKYLIGADPITQHIKQIVNRAFNFDVPVYHLDNTTGVLELFHGASLSFKDFGARFLAECLQHTQTDDQVTVLTATSGDTGGAVARAFYGQPDVQVVVVYPASGVTIQQARHFVGLGENVTSIAVDGHFDDCQHMVKQAFSDPDLQHQFISANSINVARLLAQICYYFEAIAQVGSDRSVDIAIPSGNFGNATAALMACALGLPIRTVLTVTNENDTVPRFLDSGQWEPQTVVQTITNAIDIASPNNFSRIQYLMQTRPQLREVLRAQKVSETETREAMRNLSAQGYLVDPHTALAWVGLQKNRLPDAMNIVVATAHPAKFANEVQAVTGQTPVSTHTKQDSKIDQSIRDAPTITADYTQLRARLQRIESD